MPLPDEVQIVEELPPAVRPVVAALKKHAFGMAIGTVCALGLALFAAAAAMRASDKGAQTFAWLVGNNYLPGYGPTIAGVFAGLAWGFAIGYALGFGVALTRNRMLKFVFWLLAARARLGASRNVLDDLM